MRWFSTHDGARRVKVPFASRGLSEPTRKRLELAVAVAQERLLGTHVDHALDMIDLVDGEVGFDDALDIYTRLLRLPEDEARNIGTRALAILGQEAESTNNWPERLAEEDGRDEGDERSFFGQIRQRLKGRVHDDLRRKIEFAAARTEVALLETHVANALNFITVVETQDDLKEKEIIEIYLDALDVRESIAEVAHYLALTRIADGLRERGELPPATRGRPVSKDFREPRHLKVIESEGG